MRILFFIFSAVFLTSCSSTPYDRTVTYVERDRFMGKWFVMAGRLPSSEKGAVNIIENYSWDEEEKTVQIDLSFNEGGPDGPLKKTSRKAWIVTEDHAHWKVQSTWPFKSDFLILGISTDYQWAAVGTPDQKYLRILSRKPSFSHEAVDQVLLNLKKKGYNTSDTIYVEHFLY
jgi:apolipoprotein D and lipocalin family protein